MRYSSQRSVWCAAALIGVLAILTARAELQNVVVNGFYMLPETERFVHVTRLPQDEQGLSRQLEPAEWRLDLNPGEFRNTAFRGGFSRVAVPDVPRPGKYPDLGRVALSFYYGVPQWSEETPRQGDLLVEIDGYQVFSASLTEPGWQPRLVDLRPWAGRVVSITFRGAWMDGDPVPVVIALPRIVAWHGPYYEGIGGISAIGPHCGRVVPVIQDLPMQSRWKVGVDGTLINRGPLLVEVFNVYQPAKLMFKSTAYEYTASLREGRYWMPLPLAAVDKPDAGVCALHGMVESGAVDIIPNFMEKDADYLRAIETWHKIESIQPTGISDQP